MPPDPLEALRHRFRRRCLDDLHTLRGALADPARAPDSTFATAMHRLSGAAGSFGYRELSRLAAVVDDELAQARTPTPANLERLERELEAVASLAGPGAD